MHVTASQGQSPSGFAINLSHQNDAISANADAGHYIIGAKLELVTPSLSYRFPGFPTFTESLNVDRFSVGTLGFTPRNITIPEVVNDDRPYGSFSFFSAGRTSYDVKGRRILTSEFTAGKIGATAAGTLQTRIHRDTWLGTARPLPAGWDNQVGEGFAINYHASYTKSSFHSSQFFIGYFLRNIHEETDSLNMSDMETVHVDTLMMDKEFMSEFSHLFTSETGFEFLQSRWTVGANVGLLMDNVYAAWEFDLFNFNRYSLLNAIPEFIKVYGPIHHHLSVKQRKENVRFNIFVRPAVRVIGYNALLEGLMFGDKSIHKIDHGEVSRVLFEFEFGANLLIARSLNITYSFSGRSKEFAWGDFNTWGVLTMGYSPRSWHSVEQ